jgi:hypothetical protein
MDSVVIKIVMVSFKEALLEMLIVVTKSVNMLIVIAPLNETLIEVLLCKMTL